MLAVSKTKTAKDIAAAYQVGQRHFGESYCQEALKKQQELGAFDITWHFIGPVQSNKTKALATHFTWVHSVDNFKIAKRLSEQRPSTLPPLNICLQVNISDEQSKSGITLNELPQLCELVAVLPNIKLRGVMAIPMPEEDFELQRLPYKTLYQAVAKVDNLRVGYLLIWHEWGFKRCDCRRRYYCPNWHSIVWRTGISIILIISTRNFFWLQSSGHQVRQ